MNKSIIPIIISLGLLLSGLLNIYLWYNIVGVYGLVFGVISIILAWFVFYFRHKR